MTLTSCKQLMFTMGRTATTSTTTTLETFWLCAVYVLLGKLYLQNLARESIFFKVNQELVQNWLGSLIMLLEPTFY